MAWENCCQKYVGSRSGTKHAEREMLGREILDFLGSQLGHG